MPAGAGLAEASESQEEGTGTVASVWAGGGEEKLPFAKHGNLQRR